MSGTIAGGKKAYKTNIKRHGKNYYANIGRKGGKASGNGGFASNKVGADGLTGAERAKIAGRKGGLKSKRKPASIKDITQKVQAASKLAQVLSDYIPTPIDKEK